MTSIYQTNPYDAPTPSDVYPSPLDSTTEEQKEKMAALKALAVTWEVYQVESVKAFVDNEMTLYRFLSGLHWDLEQAKAQLLDTCTWRSEVHPERLTIEDIEPFMNSTTEPIYYHFGWDKEGHPVLYIHIAATNEITDDDDGQKKMRLLCCILEDAYKRTLPTGHYKFTMVVDANRVGLTWIGTIKRFGSMFKTLGDRYTECLYKAFVVNTGWTIRAVYNVAQLFMDPITREKFTVSSGVKVLKDLIDEDALPAEFGGTSGFRYSFAEHLAVWRANQAAADEEGEGEGEYEYVEEIIEEIVEE